MGPLYDVLRHLRLKLDAKASEFRKPYLTSVQYSTVQYTVTAECVLCRCALFSDVECQTTFSDCCSNNDVYSDIKTEDLHGVFIEL